MPPDDRTRRSFHHHHHHPLLLRIVDMARASLLLPSAVAIVSLSLVLSMLAVSTRMTHAARQSISSSSSSIPSSSSPYLYAGVDTYPVIEYGLGGIAGGGMGVRDHHRPPNEGGEGRAFSFSSSSSNTDGGGRRVVIELYDPRCETCVAFAPNYAAVARRVRDVMPDVTFYGVSCMAHPQICIRAGRGRRDGGTIPRIIAYPSYIGGEGEGDDDMYVEDGGIDVPKGIGSVYLLSSRLIRALNAGGGTGGIGRRPAHDDVDASASDADASSAAAAGHSSSGGNVTTSRTTIKRSLRNSASRRQDSDDEVAIDDRRDEDLEDEEDEEEEEEDVEEEEEQKQEQDDDGSKKNVTDDDGSSPPKSREDGTIDIDDRGGEEDDEMERRGSTEEARGNDALPAGNDDGGVVISEGPKSPEGKKRMRPEKGEDEMRRPPVAVQQRQQQQQQDQRQREEKKQQQQQQPQRQPQQQLEKVQIVIGDDPGENKSGNNEDLSQVTSVYGRDRGGRAEDQDLDAQPIILEQTDAYRNTKEHFERLDIQHGKELGHHFEKYKETRNAFEESKETPGEGKGDRNVAQGQASPEIPPAKNDAGQRVGVVAGQQGTKIAPGPVQGKDWGGEFVSGGKYAPKVIETDTFRSEKFRQYVARRKETLERNEKMKHPIDALLGKNVGANNKVGDVITAARVKNSPMKNYKAQYNITAPSRQIKVPDIRPEAQQKTLGEKILKKIPIVKRAFKRSKGEETLIDASLSFTRGLISGVFKTNGALTYKQKAALIDWLELLSVSLPPEIGLHELIDTLKHNVEEISQRHENLKVLIDKHPLPENEYSMSCRKGMKPFLCGFWKLLHVMSVGFAEQAGGLALRESSPSIRVFSAKEAAAVVREYIALFFPCAECSKRFVAKYDDCSFQRCHRLSDETNDASAEIWQEFPLWLWEVHNDFSSSNLKEEVASEAIGNSKARSKADVKQWERTMNVLFPQINQCNACVKLDGTWNLNAVYNHLEDEYWTFGHFVHPKVDQFLEYNAAESNSSQFRWIYYLLFTFLIVIARSTLVKKLRVRMTGQHKKDDKFSFDRFPRNKYRDS